MKPTTLTTLAIALAATFVTVGCNCAEKTNKLLPKIDVLDDAGNPRANVDFGQVQLNTTAAQGLRVRNSGAGALTLSKVEFSKNVFATTTTFPLTISSSGEEVLAFTFTPATPDVRETGTATITSDDPSKPTVSVALSGTGVSAVAVVQPSTLAFGDVYVNENSQKTLTLTNSGSNDLVVSDVRFSSGVDPSVTADFTPMKKTLHAGESVQATITFAPTSMIELSGNVELVLPTDIGTLTVPITGKGVQALPRLCFKFADEGTEHCTDQATTFLSYAAGSLCDNRLFPSDGGASACTGLDGGSVGSSRTATLYLKNEGNTPVRYSLQFSAQVGTQCSGDAGSSIDFEFANAPDGGIQPTWTEATTSVPMLVTDPKPWETAPISLTYRPRSHCAVDAADQARVLWTRQGDPPGKNRVPQTIILNLTGQSLLPRGVPQDINISGATPQVVEFRGAGNSGDAPLRITAVTLWQAEYLSLPDGGLGRGTVPFEQCVGGSTGDCAVFGWDAGQDPASILPITLLGTPNPVPPVTQVLGRLIFGPVGGTQPLANTPYRLFAKIRTDDPYNPEVVTSIRGTRQ